MLPNNIMIGLGGSAVMSENEISFLQYLPGLLKKKSTRTKLAVK